MTAYSTSWQTRTTGLREPHTPILKPDVAADVPPPRLDHHERSRLRAQAFRAKQVYPGPVGELISRELLAFEEFGYRLAAGALVMSLVRHLEQAQPAPQERAS